MAEAFSFLWTTIGALKFYTVPPAFDALNLLFVKMKNTLCTFIPLLSDFLSLFFPILSRTFYHRADTDEDYMCLVLFVKK